MWHFIYRYLYTDIWLPVWPNWFAAVPISVWGFIKVRAWDKHHKEQKKDMQKLHKHLGIK